MRPTRRLFLFALVPITIAACSGGGSPGPGEPAPPPPGGGPGIPPGPIEPGIIGDGRLGDLVSQVRDRHELPAMGAVIVADGVIVEEAVDGLRSIDAAEPVTVGDKWHIGSVTKAMTATLAAILVEQSLLTWDTTPLDVWPELAQSIHPGYESVTITQLLSHQAGIQPDQGMIPSLDLTADDAPGSVTDKRRLWAEELLALNPANPPGEFNYANGGYIIAGAMLETLTGTAWETLMEDQVFAPLGMTNTGFRAPGTANQLDQPLGHVEQGGRLAPVMPGPDADNRQAIGPAGNVHTTMADYAAFMFAHLEGELGIPGLVSADSYRFLHAPVGGADYALGWQVDDGHAWANGPILFHLGSNLRWLANAGLVPGLNTGVFIVINAANEDARDATDEMALLLLSRVRDSRPQ